MVQRLTPSGQHQFGGSGDEVLTATDKASYLVGGSGHDPLEGGAGSDLLIGGDHDDDLFGGRGADLLGAGSGRDLLDGGKGNDTLTGGRGADRLEGGEGDDILTGGADADQFIFATGQVRLINGSTETLDAALSFGHDVIPDFDTRRARIDLRLVGEVDSSDDLVFVQEGGNVRILMADSSITLEGLHSTDLAANDFLF
ncbi:MAG TPA: calcium-binding protein [Citreicella sp.]|nr:calcium-binding protein [Citreicella sp.]